MANEAKHADRKQFSHQELREFVPKYYETGLRKPIFLHGLTGTGKSELTRKVAEDLAKRDELDFKVWDEISTAEKENLLEDPDPDVFAFMDVRIAGFKPTDLRGIPDMSPDRRQEYLARILPSWAHYITQPEAKGFVFFDEMNQAPPSVINALFEVITARDRKINHKSISDDIYFISAGNVQEDRAHTHELGGPVSDRFFHAFLREPSAGNDGAWTKYALENDVHPIVVSFLMSPVGRDHLHTHSDNHGDYLFATPRSWVEYSDYLKSREKTDKTLNQMSDEELEEIYMPAHLSFDAGTVTKFRSFIDQQRQQPLEDYIENPESILEISNETDLIWAILSGLASEYGAASEGDRAQHILTQIVKIAEILVDNAKTEFGIFLLRMAKQQNKEHFMDKEEGVMAIDTYNELSNKIQKYILPSSPT